MIRHRCSVIFKISYVAGAIEPGLIRRLVKSSDRISMIRALLDLRSRDEFRFRSIRVTLSSRSVDWTAEAVNTRYPM